MQLCIFTVEKQNRKPMKKLKNHSIKYKAVIVVFFIVTIFAASCKKKAATSILINEPWFPYETEKGLNILAFKINGNGYVYNSTSASIVGLKYFIGTDSVLQIEATIPSQNGLENVLLFITTKLTDNQPHTYPVKVAVKGLNTYVNLVGASNSTLTGYYEANAEIPSSITIKKWTGTLVNGSKKGDILSGSFELSLQDIAGKKVHLTSGRFDMSKY